jgi:prepilin-type N-terminal cleavage/methylation domain-containing protein
MKVLKNQSGFSLIELMIAASILSIMALAFSGYMKNVTSQQKNAQDKMDLMTLNSQLSSSSVDPQSIYNSATQIKSQTAGVSTGAVTSTGGYPTSTGGYPTSTGGYPIWQGDLEPVDAFPATPGSIDSPVANESYERY